jgi:hypothetical protein
MLISEGMRRAGVVTLIVVVALTAVGTAGAATPRERAQIQARAALDRALAFFHGQGTDPRGATGALLDLRLRMGSLSPAERRVARILLARPTDGHNGDWTAPKKARKHLCTTDFCVHWVKKTIDAPNLADGNHNGIPNYVENVRKVMKTVWAKEIDTLGYNEPLPDGSSGGHDGGNPNPKVDIYLQDVGRFGLYGYCTTDDPKYSQRSDVSAYCVFDDDFSKKQFGGAATGVAALKVTAAHEFHHAIQFSYDVREDRWFMEATATNMEATVYPSIHDNYQYFPSSPLSKANPWRPIDLFQSNGGNQYGVWIFFRFLCEIYTPHPIVGQPDCTVVRRFWEAAEVTNGTKSGGTYSTKAITDTLTADGKDFADLFRQFGAANAEPAAFYKDGALYPKAGSTGSNYALIPIPPDGDLDIGMFHMSNDYVRVKPNTGASSLTIDINFPGSPFSPRATVLVYDDTGALIADDEIALDGSGDAIAPYSVNPFTTATVSKVIVVYTNAGTRFNCNKGTNLSCKGNSQDDTPGNSGYDVIFDVS